MTKDVVSKGFKETFATIIAKLCYPAADEIGASFADRIGHWREENALKIAQKAERIYESLPSHELRNAHPRLVYSIIDEGSWTDDDELHSMWAGLLATSCTEGGRDESNLIFVNQMKQLTSVQALVLNHACSNAKTFVSAGGWIGSEDVLEVTVAQLQEITGVEDVHRIDRELDHLRALELIQNGFYPDEASADITPTSLGLQMYVRCQGYVGSPLEYFALDLSDSP